MFHVYDEESSGRREDEEGADGQVPAGSALLAHPVKQSRGLLGVRHDPLVHDLDRAYATALRATPPHAARVLDAFHDTRLGFAAVDDVHRCMQRETTGHRGRVGAAVWHPSAAPHTHHNDAVLAPAARRA